jgi:5-methylcytosine-specific restriction endonuclease McrA
MPKFKTKITLSAIEIDAASPDAAKRKVNKMLKAFAKSTSLTFDVNINIRPINKSNKVVCIAELDPSEVLPFVGIGLPKKEYRIKNKSYEVRMGSPRYVLFAQNPQCVVCGLQGTKVRLELPPDTITPHFNLYAIENSNYILMTKDHKIPVSKGGTNAFDNFQTMCSICNGLKGADFLTHEQISHLRKIYNEKYKDVTSSVMHKILTAEKQQWISGANCEVFSSEKINNP